MATTITPTAAQVANPVEEWKGHFHKANIGTGIVTGADKLESGTTTTISNEAVTADSKIFIMSLDSACAALIAGIYVSAKADGSFTLTHGSAAGTEDFDYLIIN